MALTEAQAEEDFHAARQRLRDTLVRIQTYRIDAMLRRDVPDVASEVAWSLAQGRFNLVTLLMEQVERYIDADANLQFAQSEGAREYEAVVNADRPDYLPSEP